MQKHFNLGFTPPANSVQWAFFWAVGLALFLSLGCSTQPKSEVDSSQENQSGVSQASLEFADQKLQSAGVTPELIASLKAHFDPKQRDRIIQLNVLGFLGKADYSSHYSPSAVRTCQRFLKKNRRTLLAAQNETGVPAEIVTALLWVETKHGQDLGRFSVLGVYYSLLQADHAEVIQKTLAQVGSRSPADLEGSRAKARERSSTKAAWALEEIKTLQILQDRGFNQLPELRGSFSGAFGIPQFLPSSYASWARAAKTDHSPNLFSEQDAIWSVGNYLKTNGWKPNDREAQRGALFHYNRAEGYVDVIFKIAEGVKKVPRQSPTTRRGRRK